MMKSKVKNNGRETTGKNERKQMKKLIIYLKTKLIDLLVKPIRNKLFGDPDAPTLQEEMEIWGVD